MIATCIGNIIEQKVEAIVNAANGIGILGAGVAGAIKRAAGDQIQREAQDICEKLGKPVLAGECYKTSAGNLINNGIRNIYHAVTMALPGSATSIEVVVLSLRNCLLRATEDGVSSIAIPGLGTGIGRLDKKEVATAMAKIAVEFENKLDIIFVDLNEEFIRTINECLK